MARYFLALWIPDTDSHEVEWKEVTREQYVKAERQAGFSPRGEDVGQPCTASFTAGSVIGKVLYND